MLLSCHLWIRTSGKVLIFHLGLRDAAQHAFSFLLLSLRSPVSSVDFPSGLMTHYLTCSGVPFLLGLSVGLNQAETLLFDSIMSLSICLEWPHSPFRSHLESLGKVQHLQPDLQLLVNLWPLSCGQVQCSIDHSSQWVLPLSLACAITSIWNIVSSQFLTHKPVPAGISKPGQGSSWWLP